MPKKTKRQCKVCDVTKASAFEKGRKRLCKIHHREQQQAREKLISGGCSKEEMHEKGKDIGVVISKDNELKRELFYGL